MKKLAVTSVAVFIMLVAVALAHTSAGTLGCPDTSKATLSASIRGDSFPAGHHVSVSLKVVDNGVTLTNGVVVADAANGNVVFGPFLVNRVGPPEAVAHATATFTIHDKAENADYTGSAAFSGTCGVAVPPTPAPQPPVVPAPPVADTPVVPVDTPLPPAATPPATPRRKLGHPTPKRRHRCTGLRIQRRVKHGPHKGQRYTECYHPPRTIRPKFTG